MSDSSDNSFESRLHPTRRNWHWLVIQFVLRLVFSFWLRFRARGIERIPNEGGGLILVNHQSFLDPMLVALPCKDLSAISLETHFSQFRLLAGS